MKKKIQKKKKTKDLPYYIPTKKTKIARLELLYQTSNYIELS